MRLHAKQGISIMVFIICIIGGVLVLVEGQDPLWMRELGWTLLGVGISYITSYLVIDTWLLRDDRDRWHQVEEKARGLIESEIFGVFSEMRLAASLGTAVTLSSTTTLDEELMAVRRAELDKTERFSTNFKELQSAVKPVLLQGGFGTIFSYRADRLNMLELKYSRHLKPDELGVIIGLQEHLRSLDTSIELIQKYRKEGTERSEVFAKGAEQNAIGYVQLILKTLIEANKMDLLPLL